MRLFVFFYFILLIVFFFLGPQLCVTVWPELVLCCLWFTLGQLSPICKRLELVFFHSSMSSALCDSLAWVDLAVTHLQAFGVDLHLFPPLLLIRESPSVAVLSLCILSPVTKPSSQSSGLLWSLFTFLQVFSIHKISFLLTCLLYQSPESLDY